MVADAQTGEVVFVVSSDADRSGTLAARVINYLDENQIRYRFNKSAKSLNVHGIEERIQFLFISDNLRMQYEFSNASGAPIITDDIEYNQLSPDLVGSLEHRETELLEYVKESTNGVS
jgi:hypothetical protein